MKIPGPLLTNDPTDAARILREYFGDPFPRNGYTGAWFDTWDSTASRQDDADRFTADDLVAITFLSVDAGPVAARVLLVDRADEFAECLHRIGPDRDLADEPGPIDRSWRAWQLETKLRTVPGIGTTIATKLIARKRPRLYPIWDTVVTDVLGTRKAHLVPIHTALTTDPYLRRRLQVARESAGLPATISELRILDVIAWMQGKQKSEVQ